MSDKSSITVDYELPHSPRKVWRALTEPALLSKWLMQNDIKPVVGHQFTFRAQPMGDWDGLVHCEVLEVEPEKRLRYSWRGGDPAKRAWRLDTTVTWTLTATATGTRLRLVHEGFNEANVFAYENMGKGWRTHLAQRMQEVLAGVPA